MLVPSFQTTSAIKNVDITVASSYYLLHHLLGNTAIHNGDSRVVYPFIMEDRLERVVSNYNIQNSAIPTVLYLGSHRVLRGEDDFLKMIGNVKKNIPNVQATLVTPDPIPSRIKRLINRYELTDALKFLPRGVQLDLADLMVKSQVYVFTGLPPVGAIDPPLTIIEALIMGTPVVSYNAGGISEILAEENLVNYGDVEELTNQVKTILEGSSVKHPRPGLLERYGSENATRNFEKFYNELV
jgi:glycosyltransferase involved in cell wall biosynthesis